MAKKKILLLGASGFLGSKLLETAPDNNDLVVSYREQRLKIKNKQVKIDLLNFNDLRQKISGIKPQIIIHAARVSSFDSDPSKAKRAMIELAKIVESVESKLIYISSDAVFDGKKGNYKESDETNPLTDHGRAKLAAEIVIKNNLNNFIIIRPSYIYDDCLNKLDKREFELLNKIKNGEIIYRFENMFRSPILVRDLAGAIWKLAAKDFVGTIHIAGERKNIYQFYMELAEKVGIDSKLIRPNFISNVNKNIAPDTSLNTDLAAKLLGGI